jgi:glycosyltransferase involved in cell wall biosynthesis
MTNANGRSLIGNDAAVRAPKISIVSPSFNQGKFLEFCLTSIGNNRASAEIEHIVMDGGSRDDSLDILKTAPQLDFWTSGPDKGQSDAINRGFAKSTGDILTWINSDDGLAPGAAAAMATTFDNLETPAWAIGQCSIIDADGREIAVWHPDRHDKLDYVLAWSQHYIMQPAVFWNRAMWLAAGPLKENMHLAMDFDLWLRFFSIAPPKLVQIPIGFHRSHADTKTSNEGGKIYSEYLSALQAAETIYGRKLKPGFADVAHALSISARSAIYHGDSSVAYERLKRAFRIAPLAAMSDPSFLKGWTKLGLVKTGLMRR